MKRKGVVYLVFVALYLSLTGVSLGADTVVWRLGGVHAVTAPETIGLNKFSELVQKNTKGRLKVEIYPAGQLGKEVPQLENLIIGTQQMFGNVADWNENIVKDWGIVGMPFAFDNLDHVRKFQKSQEYERLKRALLDQKGVRILADNWYRLPKALLCKKPIHHPKDLEGVKLRMPHIKTYVETWGAMGAKTIVIPWAEAFIALKTGVADGMDSPLGSIYGQKFHQAAPNIIMTNHLVAPFNLLANNKAYQDLPAELQQGLSAAALEAGNYYTALVEERFKPDKQKMIKEGARFIDVDPAEFAAVAQKVAEDLEAHGQWSKGLFAKVRALR
jgi:tripartite ATP-independent transporter DctP family solute receptor